LSTFHPADKAGIETAEKTFSGMAGGVYGASFKSSPSEFGAFYAWLAFLRGKDPQAERSRTVSTVVNGDLLKEMEAPKPAQVKRERPAALQRPVPVAAQAEQAREIPRLRPVRSLYGTVGRIMFNRHNFNNSNGSGYCGDGICSAAERANPGRCPRDCGR
jgi:hypothetical protein